MFKKEEKKKNVFLDWFNMKPEITQEEVNKIKRNINKKKMQKVLRYLGMGAFAYIAYKIGSKYGAEFKKEQIVDGLLNCDFVAEIGKNQTVTLGINSIDDISGNTVLLFPKK